MVAFLTLLLLVLALTVSGCASVADPAGPAGHENPGLCPDEVLLETNLSAPWARRLYRLPSGQLCFLHPIGLSGEDPNPSVSHPGYGRPFRPGGDR